CFSLQELGRKYGFEIRGVGNLNGPEAMRVLTECNADLGIVLGTRILKRTTFSVPRLGSINLHKGKVPEYRGMPPGFWELYDGAREAGVTVHFVDDGLDTGDIVYTAGVPILPLDTPVSLREKLNQKGACAMAEAVSLIQAGSRGQAQVPTSVKPRLKPRRAEVLRLRKQLPH